MSTQCQITIVYRPTACYQVGFKVFVQFAFLPKCHKTSCKEIVPRLHVQHFAGAVACAQTILRSSVSEHKLQYNASNKRGNSNRNGCHFLAHPVRIYSRSPSVSYTKDSCAGCPGLCLFLNGFGAINSLLKYVSQPKIATNSLKKPYFSGSRSLKVIDVGTPGKLVSSACYDSSISCCVSLGYDASSCIRVTLYAFSCSTSIIHTNIIMNYYIAWLMHGIMEHPVALNHCSIYQSIHQWFIYFYQHNCCWVIHRKRESRNVQNVCKV